MLLFAAGVTVLAGAFVAVFGQEPRVRGWFALMCLSAAALTSGLWVELRYAEHAFLAARANMLTALVLAFAGCTCGLLMCGARWHRPALALFALAAVLNVATVWGTDMYFTGEYVRYGWGGYVVANARFAINPILVACVGVYTLVVLARRYPRAHPLDRNRILYVVLSWAILSTSVLDYLPHFGVNVFDGPVSAIALPLFVSLFGYALLRFRLVEFRALVLRSSGWVVTLVLVATAYVLALEAGDRWLRGGVHVAHVGAAVLGLATFSAVGRTVPGWFSRLSGAAERGYQDVVDAFTDDIRGLVDEPTMRLRLEDVCTGALGASAVELLDAAEVAADPEAARAVDGAALVECELLRRRGASSPVVDRGEILVPLRRGGVVLGALLLGKRSDGDMYPRRLLDALRTIANVFTVGLVNARAAKELEQRHRLDRYLPPQLVERALLGQATALEGRRRRTVTIVFSDLKDFTPIADRLSPDVLSAILNQYLSAMSDVAFDHGGTVDKFIGDAVMVLFGAPVDLEPAAQVERALAMAVAMNDRLTALNARWTDKGFLDRPLQCRIGIHTGEATVGSFGSRARADYTAVGRAVNLASRLESACPPGRVLLSAAAWALVADRVVWKAEPREPLTAKGFATPVDVVELDPATADARACAGHTSAVL